MAHEERLTKEQRDAVAFQGHLALVSCPGSGKTRVVVAKLLACTQQVIGTPRKIACITYTNAGVSEIEHRVRQLAGQDEAEACEVSTIHGFCLNRVIRPFSSRIEELKRGFSLVGPDSEAYQFAVNEVIKRYGLRAHQAESLSLIQRKLDGTLFIPRDIPSHAAYDFVDLLSKPGMLTLADILYYSARLVANDAEVALAISCRFQWILVDEFQDTTDLQASMLTAIETQKRTTLFIVGDPHQSIFAFAGARPDLMLKVAQKIGARTDVSLSGNYRSSSKIVAAAENLLSRKPSMEAVGRAKNFPADVTHVHSANSLQGILGSYLPALERLKIHFGSSAILSPQWPMLYRLGRSMREKHIPIVGPGARPYRKSLEFAQLAEALCAHLEGPSPESASQLQRSLYQMLLLVGAEATGAVYSFEGKRILFSILTVASNQRKKSKLAIDWLLNTSKECEDILIANDIIPVTARGKISSSGRAMVDAIRKNVPTHASLSVDDLSIFAKPSECIHLQTMHSSKGREYDAVALIGFNENLIPHFASKSTDEVAEARRLAYVGVTRAKRLLMIISDASDYRNPPSRFLDELGFP